MTSRVRCILIGNLQLGLGTRPRTSMELAIRSRKVVRPACIIAARGSGEALEAPQRAPDATHFLQSERHLLAQKEIFVALKP